MADDKQEREPSSVDFERMSKQRHRWAYVALAVVVGVGVVVWLALRKLEHDQQARLASAWSELNACLLGGPLDAGQSAAARVRSMQLSIMGVPLEKRAKLGDYAWPGSCGRYGHAVSEALRERNKTQGLAESAEKLAKALQDEKSDQADLTPLIERAWSDAQALGLTVSPAPSVAPPPPAQAALTLESLPASARLSTRTFPLANVRTPTFSHPALWFLVDMPESGSLLCHAVQAHAAVSCKKLPDAAAKLGPGLRLWGTTDDDTEPMLFAGDRGSAGIVRMPSGAKLAEVMTYGAYARRDGSATLLVWNDAGRDVRFVRYPKEGPPSEQKVLDAKDIGNPYYVTGLIWGWLVYEAYDKEADEIRMYARRIPDAGTKLGPLTIAGKVWEPGVVRAYQEEPLIVGCRTDKALAVVLAGRGHDSVSFFTDGKWTTPVPSEQSGGTVTCRGIEATTTRVVFTQKANKSWPTVTQSRCNVSACSGTTVRLEDLIPGLVDLAPAETRQVQAADVDGNLALIWHGGDHGGLRMRFAPAERMRDVPDRVIYDDVFEGGKRAISNLLEARMLPGQGFALLLLSTTAGVHVLRIDAKGSVAGAAVTIQ